MDLGPSGTEAQARDALHSLGEYIGHRPDGLRYSRFCELYRAFAAKLPVVMRLTHAAGEKLFVDYAGDTMPVIANRLTGEWRNPTLAHLWAGHVDDARAGRAGR